MRYFEPWNFYTVQQPCKGETTASTTPKERVSGIASWLSHGGGGGKMLAPVCLQLQSTFFPSQRSASIMGMFHVFHPLFWVTENSICYSIKKNLKTIFFHSSGRKITFMHLWLLLEEKELKEYFNLLPKIVSTCMKCTHWNDHCSACCVFYLLIFLNIWMPKV